MAKTQFPHDSGMMCDRDAAEHEAHIARAEREGNARRKAIKEGKIKVTPPHEHDPMHPESMNATPAQREAAKMATVPKED